jgi:hypothetical protein
MKNLLLTFIVLFSGAVARAQRIQVELLGGISNYQGDLLPILFTFRQAQPAFNANIKYQLNNHFYLRGGVGAGSVRGNDEKNREYLQVRNLNFQSRIAEANFGVEYDVLSLENTSVTPYFFTGIGIFHFNPYTYDQDGQKTYLQPLSTEGQGLSEYPDRKVYALTQPCWPLVAGVKYEPCINLQIAWELGFRKLFTDYLDDVSDTYVSEAALLNERGAQAVDLSYRGDELPGGDPNYPKEFVTRGNKSEKDWYYFSGLKLTVRLGNGGLCNNRGSSKRSYDKLGCPKVL